METDPLRQRSKLVRTLGHTMSLKGTRCPSDMQGNNRLVANVMKHHRNVEEEALPNNVKLKVV